jgi:uncharacterized protein (TIGR02246 family)
MKSPVWSILALASAAAGLGQATAAPSDDERAIRALEDRVVAAVNARDVAAIMKDYARGDELFVFDLGLPRQHAGWDAYRLDWQDFFALLKGPPQLEVRDFAVTLAGRFAYSHCIQHVSWTNKDGSSTELDASVTDVYRKTGGRWRIVQEHLSVPIHIATGRAEMLSTP